MTSATRPCLPLPAFSRSTVPAISATSKAPATPCAARGQSFMRHHRGQAACARPDLTNEFPRVDPALEDALTSCDMTTAPGGLPVYVQSRLSEIVKRYGPFDVVTRFITKAKPHLTPISTQEVRRNF